MSSLLCVSRLYVSCPSDWWQMVDVLATWQSRDVSRICSDVEHLFVNSNLSWRHKRRHSLRNVSAALLVMYTQVYRLVNRDVHMKHPVGTPQIFIWKLYAKESGRRKSHSGVQGQSSCRGSGGLPHKMKQFADILYRFWLQKRSKYEHIHATDPLLPDQSVSQWEAKRHFVGEVGSASKHMPGVATANVSGLKSNCVYLLLF